MDTETDMDTETETETEEFPELSGLSGLFKHTTKRREWWGWLGCMTWMFMLMYGYDAFIPSDAAYLDSSPVISSGFMLVFALSLILFGYRFGQNPGGLSRIAFYTTPVAVLITAVFPLLPEIPGAALYIFAPVLFAPALLSRVFGVLRTADSSNRLTRYISAVSVCVVIFMAWLIIDLPGEIAFLVPALLAVPAWLGVRREIPLPEKLPPAGAFRLSKLNLLLFGLTLIALYWLDTMSSIIHTLIISAGIEGDDVILLLLGMLLPAAGFILYGVISDKGGERLGFICGMSLFLVGLIFELMPAETHSVLSLPMTFADGLGGTYPEFFILTIPIFFINRVKRPVLMASLGVIINLVSSALQWAINFWIPEIFITSGPPLLVSAAVSAVAFVLLAFLLFDRNREKTLAAALYASLHSAENSRMRRAGDLAPKTENQGMANAGLTPEETEIALLLIEGKTRSEITRRLRIKAVDANRQMNSIRNKLIGANDPYPNITAIANKYGLTGREKDMLRCLYQNMTNAAIAAEMFLSEGTVRIHVRNLLKKLPVGNRRDVADWAGAFETETET